jgi:large subunit ribosomal protein L32
MAVPKKRKSHSRARTQRNHDHLTPRNWVTCPQCQETRTLHQVCPSCGYYRTRAVIRHED